MRESRTQQPEVALPRAANLVYCLLIYCLCAGAIAGDEPPPPLEPVLQKLRAELDADPGDGSIGDLGKAERWELNQPDGVLRFFFEDESVGVAPAQIIGLYEPGADGTGVFTWAWASPAVEYPLTRRASYIYARIREAQDQRFLKPSFKTTEDEAMSLATYALRLTPDAAGVFRANIEGVIAYVVFAMPLLSHPDMPAQDAPARVWQTQCQADVETTEAIDFVQRYFDEADRVHRDHAALASDEARQADAPAALEALRQIHQRYWSEDSAESPPESLIGGDFDRSRTGDWKACQVSPETQRISYLHYAYGNGSPRAYDVRGTEAGLRIVGRYM